MNEENKPNDREGEMKRSKFVLMTLLLLVAVSSLAYSINSEKQYKQIEDNLIVGLNTDNEGLKISCTYFLGEIKSDKAVIPLMRILKSSEVEEERIAAALALVKINSDKGLFTIKQRIKFDDSERVQRMCAIFYNQCLLDKVKGEVFVEPFHIVDLNLEYKGIKLACQVEK